MNKITLEPTAALVMQWSLELYREESLLRFINLLDFSSGSKLFDKCNSICNWYKEVILNRKSLLKNLIEKEISGASREYQIILMAAGKSPLSLEILLHFPSIIYRIFEIDVSGMDDKQQLIHKLFPQFDNKIGFISSDIMSPDMLNLLNKTGYRHDLPTIVVMEGISYYLKKQELLNIVAKFQNENKVEFIIEYLVPNQFVTQSRRKIPEKIFHIIRKDCNLDRITVYTKNALQDIFQTLGFNITAHYTLADMELARMGANKYFLKPDDGWIECVVLRFPTSCNS